MNDKKKSLLIEIKSEKKNKNKILDKIKILEIELVKIKYAKNPNKLQSALKELNKIQLIDEDLHENEDEIFVDYAGDFEMVGSLKVGDQSRGTHIRFRNITDYEDFINSIDEGFDAEDASFNGYFHKFNTPQFTSVNKSQNGNGCDFKHEIFEYRGNNCFIPSK